MFELSRIPYFVAVAEASSFAKAAEQLRVAKSAVSTQVLKLEKELAVQLFNRTTRQVQLTPAGAEFLSHCRNILEIRETAHSGATEERDEISGLIRITSTSDTGPLVLAPILSEFSRKHPKVEIDLVISDDVLDLVSHRLDLAIREGDLTPSSLKAMRLRDFEQWVVCGKKYASEVTPKDSPEHLKNLRWAIVSNVQEAQTWVFTTPTDQKRRLRVESTFRSNNTMAVLNWTENCPGCAVLPDYLVRSHIEDGRIVRLVPYLKLPDYKMHAVYLASTRLPKRTRLLLDFIKLHLG